MDNITTKIVGKKLTVTIDLEKDFGYSKSGKTITIATSHGFQAIPKAKNGARMNLHVSRYPTDEDEEFDG